ncbi:MAG TPA: class I SAM-dependent methyltransferase [Pyrinomonadaceae bacterium]|nr:class I SAM-dependent methyltransferase [Pyrinomonadaceae bacterium]
MSKRVDLFESIYGNFGERVVEAIRKETFGRDIGQNSWLTADEYDRFIPRLGLAPGAQVLEVASGSGGPALYLAEKTGCRVTGIDASENGVATATRAAADAGKSGRVSFRLADANAPLPFEDDTFDAVVCIDSMNHLADRPGVLREWRRVLRAGGRALFTDPVLITGPVTNDELAVRSSVGLFLFVPEGTNERLIEESGLSLFEREDVTGTAALVSGRWHAARASRREALLRIEGEGRFEGLQDFFAVVQRLTTERRLSRVAYLAEKRDA